MNGKLQIRIQARKAGFRASVPGQSCIASTADNAARVLAEGHFKGEPFRLRELSASDWCAEAVPTPAATADEAITDTVVEPAQLLSVRVIEGAGDVAPLTPAA